MEAEWELFESEILREITDSQFAFQVIVGTIEVRVFPEEHSIPLHSIRLTLLS